jgi:hypothetical protein
MKIDCLFNIAVNPVLAVTVNRHSPIYKGKMTVGRLTKNDGK